MVVEILQIFRLIPFIEKMIMNGDKNDGSNDT